MNLKSFSELPSIPEPPPPKSPPIITSRKLKDLGEALKRFTKPQFKKRELIAGGDIRWKPIDKPAAMLLAKVADIYKPQPDTMKDKNTAQLATLMNQEQKDAQAHKGAHSPEVIASKMAQELPRQVTEYADILRVARASLDMAHDMFSKQVIEFAEDMPKHLDKLRQWRMTMEREKDISLRALKDLRQFFLDSDYEKEMTRLNAFVLMAERLAALAKDGTLEKISDVMLKLSMKPSVD